MKVVSKKKDKVFFNIKVARDSKELSLIEATILTRSFPIV